MPKAFPRAPINSPRGSRSAFNTTFVWPQEGSHDSHGSADTGIEPLPAPAEHALVVYVSLPIQRMPR